MSKKIVGGCASNGNIAVAMQAAKPIKKAVKSAKSPSKANPPDKPSQDKPSKPAPKTLSLRDRLLGATEANALVKDLQATLADAKACQNDEVVINGFVELVRQSDELAIYILSQTMPESEAKEKWLDNMSWDDQEAQLKSWADDGNDLAKTILNGLTQFNENALLRKFLREVFCKFVEPLQWINTYAGLRRFLDELVEEGVVHSISRPNRKHDNGVELPGQDDLTLYLPVKGVKLAEGGWPYVKEAMVRAKANEDSLEKLRKKSTQGLTPAKISRGIMGILFLRLSALQAVLLEAFELSGHTMVKIIDSVGLNDEDLPSGASAEALWDERSHQTEGRGKWSRINASLRSFAEKARETSQKIRSALDERLRSLTSVSNISFSFADRGLLRMIRGENGTITIWSNQFRWGREEKQKVGLFAIAVERDKNDFVLRGVVGDFQFPVKKLVGEILPLEWDDNPENPSIKLKTLSQLEPTVYFGLKMVEVLLKLRLGAELYFSKGSTKDA